jgi:hypothetical protein
MPSEHHTKHEVGFDFHPLLNPVISRRAQMDRSNLGWNTVDAERLLLLQLLAHYPVTMNPKIQRRD